MNAGYKHHIITTAILLNELYLLHVLNITVNHIVRTRDLQVRLDLSTQHESKAATALRQTPVALVVAQGWSHILAILQHNHIRNQSSPTYEPSQHPQS